MSGSKISSPLLRTLAGQACWPPPIWLMRQAGRYLPEYRALREQAGDFLSLCRTPDLATEVTLQPVRRFGLDAAILFSDILILPWALGSELRFAAGEGPILSTVRDIGAVNALNPVRVAEQTQPILQTIRQVKAALPEEVPLIGFAGAPFTVACYMVEGRGGTDFPTARLAAHADAEFFTTLIDLLTESSIAYLGAQVEAGADVVMLFDSWAGLLPPSLFHRFVVTPTHRIVQSLREKFPELPIIGFPRMAGTMLSSYLDVGCQGIGIDTAADMSVVAEIIPPGVALQGNLDPLLLVTGGEAMARDAEALALSLHDRPHIFNLGHGILPQTPPEHVAQLVELVRNL